MAKNASLCFVRIKSILGEVTEWIKKKAVSF
jgi:hypothetical protein